MALAKLVAPVYCFKYGRCEAAASWLLYWDLSLLTSTVVATRLPLGYCFGIFRIVYGYIGASRGAAGAAAARLLLGRMLTATYV